MRACLPVRFEVSAPAVKALFFLADDESPAETATELVLLQVLAAFLAPAVVSHRSSQP